jgi:hypothetical protein
MNEELTKLELELYDALLTVSDDGDFLFGTMCATIHDDDRQSIIDFIKKGKNVTSDNVVYLAGILNQKRQGLIN